MLGDSFWQGNVKKVGELQDRQKKGQATTAWPNGGNP
jgi:hypothetical protein